jgi:hypothetical protein
MTFLLANAGTPLLWLTALHLYVGNFMIGVGEGLLLRWAFGVRTARGVPRMIGANYASAVVGFALTAGVDAVFRSTLEPRQAAIGLALSCVLYFAATVIVEWPFVAWAMGPGERRAKRSLLASFVVNAASYAALVPLYAHISTVSAVTDTTQVDPSAFASGPRATVFYLDRAAAAVYEVALDGSGRRRVAEVSHLGRDPRLVADPNAGVVRVMDADAPPIPTTGRVGAPRPASFGPAVDLDDGEWDVETGFWAVQGLRATPRGDGTPLHLALETPFILWQARDATLLPGGVVVFALGPHVVVLELKTRRFAVLAEGSSPVVALETR